MSIFRNKAGKTYWYKFKRDGRTFQGPTQATDKVRARAFERAEKARIDKDLAEQRSSGQRPMTLDTCFALYADEVAAFLPSREAIEAELHWIEEAAGADGGAKKILPPDKPLHEITSSDIMALISARRACMKPAGYDEKGRPAFKRIANGTVNRTVEVLRAALYHARDNHNAHVRPLKFRKLAEPRARVREMSAVEEASICEALRDDYQDIFAFALLTGIRFEGIVSLTWPTIDFANRMIRYVKKRKPGGEPEWGHLPMTAQVEAVLRRQCGHDFVHVWTFVAQGRGGKGGTGGAVEAEEANEFVAGQRYPITYWNLQTQWRRARAKAGLPDLRFHDLRHTAATRMLRVIGNLALVQEMLGHASPVTTRKYAHVSSDDLRAAMERADAANPCVDAAGSLKKSLKSPKLKLVD
jgi:integrase